MRRRKGSASRVLDDLVQLARREPPPPVDWSRLESHLRRVATTDERRAPPKQTWRPSPIWALAAAAILTACVVLFLRTRPTPEALRERAGQTSTQSAKGAQADTAVAADIVATSAPRRVEHAGVASWTLSPGSAARVESSDPITVRLIEGTLSAEVTPRNLPESFVVVAANTRVAVHGTRFQVRLSDRDRTVRVQVQEGIVGVRPLGDPNAEETVLRAPADTLFALTGTPLPTDEPPRTPKTAASARSAAPAPDGSLQDLPEVPDLSDGSRHIEGLVQRCFEENTSTDQQTRVSVATRLTARINPAGRIFSAEFQPPLAPAVEACVGSSLSTIEFPKSTAGAELDRQVTVQR